MNPIDTLKAGAAGIAEKFTGENPKLFAETIKLVQGMPDGFSGLKKQFQDKGLGTLVSSLTGKAPSQAILPEQMVKGFGKEKIDALAASTGLDPKIVPEKLAGILPKVFEKFAPKVAAKV
jgi:uncharacterized protein YidB (DUF937 family)